MIPQPDGTFRTADGRYEVAQEEQGWIIFDLHLNEYFADDGEYESFATSDDAADALDGYLNGGPLE